MGSLSGLRLVEAIASFLRSEAYARPINAFVERECLVFETPGGEAWPSMSPGSSARGATDTGEGFTLALSEVQVQYSNLASSLIEKHLHSLGASWDKLQAACLKEHAHHATKTVRNALEPCTDFPAFFDMMAESNLALEAKALELWHMQTQFGFDEEDLAAEDEDGGDMPAPLPGIQTLCREYGLSEVTMRELALARAEMHPGESEGDSAVGNLMSALGGEDSDEDDDDPLKLLGPSTSKVVGGAGGSGTSPRPEAPAIQVSENSGTGTYERAAKSVAASGLHKDKALNVMGPPSPRSSRGSEEANLSGPTTANPKRVPASDVSAGPLSAPAKSAPPESPRVSKPGDPDYDENTTLHVGKSRWKIGRQIGRGATARVFLAVDMDLHRTFAVKQISTSQSQTEVAALQELEREIAVMKKLSHPNLVRYLGTERTDDELYIAMEYVRGGALADLIKRIAAQQNRQRQQREAAAKEVADSDGGAGSQGAAPTDKAPSAHVVLPLRTIASYTAQVLAGLAYLHEEGVIHRDIKSANILVDATYQHVKIADFGSSRVLEAAQEAGIKTDGAQTLKGTPFWMSPEVIKGTGYGRKADVWSVGCVCVEMLTGRPPWSSQLGDKAHPYAIMYHIVNATEPPDYPEGLPDKVVDVMNLMFERDTTKRPSAVEMLDYEWIAAAIPKNQPPPPKPLRQSVDLSANRPALSAAGEAH